MSRYTDWINRAAPKSYRWAKKRIPRKADFAKIIDRDVFCQKVIFMDENRRVFGEWILYRHAEGDRIEALKHYIVNHWLHEVTDEGTIYRRPD